MWSGSGKRCFYSSFLSLPTTLFFSPFFVSIALWRVPCGGWPQAWWLFWEVCKLYLPRNYEFVCFLYIAGAVSLGTIRLMSIYAFSHHNSHLCWFFAECLLWLLASESVFLLPLSGKHHVQQQIWVIPPVAGGSGSRDSRWWLLLWDSVWFYLKTELWCPTLCKLQVSHLKCSD